MKTKPDLRATLHVAFDQLRWLFSQIQLPRRHHMLWGAGGMLTGMVVIALAAAVIASVSPEPVAPSPMPSHPGDISITMDDTFLTSLVIEGVRQANLPVRVTQVQAHIQPGSVVVVQGHSPLLNRQLTMTAHLEASNGTMVMHIASVTIGGLNMPARLFRSLEQRFNAEAASIIGSLKVGGRPYVVHSVSSVDGLLTIALSQA